MNLLASLTTFDLKKGSSEVENTSNKKNKKTYSLFEESVTHM